MYVPAPQKPLLRKIVRFAAWKAGDALTALLSRVTGFRVPDEPLQPFIHNLPMLLGTYERETLAVMRQVVKPGMTVVDAGAHAGYYTVALSKLVGAEGRVLAFEMNPPSLELLRHNTTELVNVTIIPAALGASDGEATMYEADGLTASASMTSTKPGLSATGTVPVRSLASVLSEHGLKADFIKLDIEGAEPEVLRSLSGPVTIVFEVKRYILEAAGETPEDFLNEMMALGYTVRVIGGQRLARLGARQTELDKANILASR